MNPLLFADWGKIYRIFRALMSILVLVLCVMILMHIGYAHSAPLHHPHPIILPR